MPLDIDFVRQQFTQLEDQPDFVFASKSLAGQVNVTALNSEEFWGPSDHCKLEITI